MSIPEHFKNSRDARHFCKAGRLIAVRSSIGITHCTVYEASD